MLNVVTIVLNGMPFLVELAQSLQKCNLDWRWTIVYGVADPVGCTSWCQQIDPPADDGTLNFLLRLRDKFSDQVRVRYRKNWPGKLAMVNAALETFDTAGTLMQMDADEVWAPRQIDVVPALFRMHPTADAALFMSRVWVGENRFVCTPATWGNHSKYEWVRAWRFSPGMKFEKHEPPVMEGARTYIDQTWTTQLGLVFDHYSYVTRSQIEFKHRYYGDLYDPLAWDRLQAVRGPVDLLGVLPWVKESVISHEI